MHSETSQTIVNTICNHRICMIDRNKTSTVITRPTLNKLILGPLAMNLYIMKTVQIKDTLSSQDEATPYCVASKVTPA